MSKATLIASAIGLGSLITFSFMGVSNNPSQKENAMSVVPETVPTVVIKTEAAKNYDKPVASVTIGDHTTVCYELNTECITLLRGAVDALRVPYK